MDAPENTASHATFLFKVFTSCTVVVYLVFSWYFQTNYHLWIRASRNLSNVVLIPGICLLLYCYYRGYGLLRNHASIGIKHLIISSVLIALAAVSIPSFYSTDVLSYINYGWQQARYQANPYCLLVAGTEGCGTDPMFTETWMLTPMTYGFAFANLTRVICQLSQGNLNTAVLLFKAINFCAWLLLGAVVYFGALKFKLPRPDLSLYLYAWSPIVLLQSLCGCHNDILMILLVMAAFYVVARSTRTLGWLAAPLLTTGILVKYVWVFAVPFMLVFFGRRKDWTTIFTWFCLAVITVAIFGWSYKCDPSAVRWIELNASLTTSTNSLPAVIQAIGKSVELACFHQVTPSGAAMIVATSNLGKAVLLAVFSIVLSRLVITAWRKQTEYNLCDVINDSLIATTLFICFVSSKFYPWYVIMFFPICLWLPEQNRLRNLAITLSCTQVLAITFVGHGHVNNFLLLTLLPTIIWWRSGRPAAKPLSSQKSKS